MIVNLRKEVATGTGGVAIFDMTLFISAGFAIASLEVAIKQENSELKAENERLHNLVTSLHDRYNNMSSEVKDAFFKSLTGLDEPVFYHSICIA